MIISIVVSKCIFSVLIPSSCHHGSVDHSRHPKRKQPRSTVPQEYAKNIYLENNFLQGKAICAFLILKHTTPQV